jgi:gamma-glutamyl hercynylcysteine S-oxide synthase
VPLARPAAPTRREVIERLAEARTRTVLLATPLSGAEMIRQPGPPIGSVLDQLDGILGFEQSALLGEPEGRASESYDAWFDRMMDLRQRVLERLEAGAEWPRSARDYLMVIEHELRRNESILEIVQALGQPYEAPHQRSLPRGRSLGDPGSMVRFPGGRVEIGQDDPLVGWPDEHPAHRVEVGPFWIDLMPVTNAEYLVFVAAGGYRQEGFWSPEGWDWVQGSGAAHPANWYSAAGAWWARWLGRETPLDPSCPVCQVSLYEAEAFAAFVGKRLPTEPEWEAAAAWDPERQIRRRYPWGNIPPSPHVANLDQLGFGPAPVGAYPGNVSPIGCYGMIGDVWEWTSSRYQPYPGGAPVIPSEARNRVLRGGSWATRAGAARVTARRAESPAARHLFAGFRCARS